ncbi:MAG: hypothetical protein M3Y87_11900, partial [Myxococcota bacterium]|nr:hypothetical protein [Myxococcota bacterium]
MRAALRIGLALAMVGGAIGACSPGRSGPPGTRRDGSVDLDPDGFVMGCESDADTDGDGIADSREGTGDLDGDGTGNHLDDDSDGDGISDADEARSSNPCAPRDSDGDGTPDFADLDADNDGVSDADELAAGTDPTNIDSDDDGVSDLAERAAGTDPTDATSTIPEGDFFVVLPYNGERALRPLRFGTTITQADVFFLMDTTGSMYSEVGNVQMGMEATIIPGVLPLIPDVQFGAGGFDDFPVGSHGGGSDAPYYHLIDIVPYDEDRGALGATFIPSSDVRTFSASGMNGTRDIIDAVRGYPRHSGANGCESGVEALYQVATGAGVSWGSGAVPAKTCGSIPDEVGMRRGYPCFRPGSLPIIVFVSDAPFHEPLPAGWPLDTLEGASCTYGSAVASAQVYDGALAALRGIGARVVSLSTDSIPSNPGYPATAQMCNLARDTGSVRADGTPLCFELGTSGTMITSEVVNAIAELVGGTPQDVSTITENVPGVNPDDFDATLFIKSITPDEGYRDGVPGANPGVSYASKDATT